MPEFDKNEVRAFLRTFKRLLASNHFHLVDREKTDTTLIQLGWTRKNLRDELLALTVLDYCSGPDPDMNRPGVVWVFGKRVDTHEVYIKLKIVQRQVADQALCLSFHMAERPLDYPFKESNTH